MAASHPSTPATLGKNASPDLHLLGHIRMSREAQRQGLRIVDIAVLAIGRNDPLWNGACVDKVKYKCPPPDMQYDTPCEWVENEDGSWSLKGLVTTTKMASGEENAPDDDSVSTGESLADETFSADETSTKGSVTDEATLPMKEALHEVHLLCGSVSMSGTSRFQHHFPAEVHNTNLPDHIIDGEADNNSETQLNRKVEMVQKMGGFRAEAKPEFRGFANTAVFIGTSRFFSETEDPLPTLYTDFADPRISPRDFEIQALKDVMFPGDKGTALGTTAPIKSRSLHLEGSTPLVEDELMNHFGVISPPSAPDIGSAGSSWTSTPEVRHSAISVEGVVSVDISG
jgi:hypothetical protein